MPVIKAQALTLPKRLMKYAPLLISMLLLAMMDRPMAQEPYRLAWSDEFEGSGLPDSANWDYDTGKHGWGNNELQDYTRSLENSEVKDGILIIRAVRSGEEWTSARLVSRNKRDFLFGRVEVRAKLPAGRGTWPAIWMLPTGWEYGGWPNSGEIDIMEHVGYEQGLVYGTVHTGAYNHVKETQVGSNIQVPDCSVNFHIYAIEWSESGIDFFVDEQKYFTFENDHKGDPSTWPFDKHFHIILNIAVGGNWGGKHGVDPSMQEAVMEIDYVRVYDL
jgi:beta-glucanase (GH16 family)